MLKELKVKNYALIQDIHIQPHAGFNVMTGETGAGKSILLGALSLILGERADTTVLYNPEEKCLVEGVFTLNKANWEAFFEKHDLDFESESILRREINSKGRSRAFINDTPVQLSVLKDMAPALIDVHSQHQSILNLNPDYYLQLIDHFAGLNEEKKDYQLNFTLWKKDTARLIELQEKESKQTQELDYKQYLWEELSSANLQIEEKEALEAEQELLQNAGEIIEICTQSANQLGENEQNINAQLQAVLEGLKPLARNNKKLQELYDRIKSSAIELEEAGRDLSYFGQNVAIDPQRLAEVESRLDLIYSLERKHQVNNVEDLLAVLQNLEEELGSFGDLSDAIRKLERTVELGEQKVISQAKFLNKQRQKAIPAIEKKLLAGIKELSMPKAQLSISLTEQKELGASGFDKAAILFTANVGSPLLPLENVASGGEVSRIMLVIKSLLAEYEALPTLVFDEIDSGISGEIASKVGAMLTTIAKNHQLMVITHLAQVAAKGVQHLYLYKGEEKGRTSTKIKVLAQTERAQYIAQMLSGDKPSQHALSTAKELLAS